MTQHVLNMQTDIVVRHNADGSNVLSCDNGAVQLCAPIAKRVAGAIGVPRLPQRPGHIAPQPFNMQTDAATKVTTGRGSVTIAGPTDDNGTAVVKISGSAYTDLGGTVTNDEAPPTGSHGGNMQTDTPNAPGL